MLLDNNADLYMDIGDLYLSTYHDIMGTDVWERGGAKVAEYAAKAKETGFSYYGLRSIDEFVAESVAHYFCTDSPSEISKMVISALVSG